MYLSFPSAKDPDFERRHPGKATIEIVAPAPYEIFAPWAGKTWGKRGDDYEALKQAYGERLLEHLYDKVPQVRGRVDYWEVSTPLSMQWFCGWERGELYGLDHDPSRMRQGWLRPRTKRPRAVAHRAGHHVLRRERRDDGRARLGDRHRGRAAHGAGDEARLRLSWRQSPSARRSSRPPPSTGGHQK